MASFLLYPPIVDTYMPAFGVNKQAGEDGGTGTARIYFSVSAYNDNSKLNSIWVSIVNPFTNLSVVDKTVYKSELIALSYHSAVKIDSSREDNQYYIELNEQYLQDKKWISGQTYKVQLRFCEADINNSDEGVENTMNWVSTHTNLFSEWSSICLLQPITPPKVSIKNFDINLNTDIGEDYIFGVLDNVFTGTVSFETEDNDSVESYCYKLFDEQGQQVYDSGKIYSLSSSAQNDITHNLQYMFEDGVRYTLQFSYISQKLYSETKNYNFLALDSNGAQLEADLYATPESETGRIKLRVVSETERFFGNLTIRRTSNLSNFTIWEDIHHINHLLGDELLDITWYDNTVESGVWYKYCIQKRSVSGYRGIAVMSQEPVMALFEDTFLIGEGRQLNIKFNPQINTFSYVKAENSVQTIGSKYPFIKRNANVHYRQFAISGLISMHMDEQELFATKTELYNNANELYENFNETNNITAYNDIILEKKFRDKVQEFLYDGKVKLFKSNTEGNILVRLMNVTFTPERTLGRMLYNFNATAYEIADCSISNLDKYNIQKIGRYDKQLELPEQRTFNYTKLMPTEEEFSLVTAIQEEMLLHTESPLLIDFNSKTGITTITDLQLQMTSEPYPIVVITSADGQKTIYQKFTNNTIDYITKNESYQIHAIVNGYLAILNNQSILIPETGILNFNKQNIALFEKLKSTDDALQIDDFKLLGEDTFSIQCNYHTVQMEDPYQIPTIMVFRLRDGQEQNNFNLNDNVLHTFIYDKYLVNETKNGKLEYQKLYSLDSISIEAEPGTVCYLQDASDNKYRRFVIGDTGYLNLTGNEYSLTGLYFTGTHLTEQERVVTLDKYKNKYPRQSEFQYDLSNTIYDNIYKNENNVNETYIKNPQERTVYKVKDLNENSLLSSLSLYDDIVSKDLSNNYLIDLYDWITMPYEKNETTYFEVIYYQNQWWIFTPNHDVLHPVFGTVNYQAEIERSYLGYVPTQ